MMDRRSFVVTTSAAVAWPPVARAQTPRVPLVAYLGFSSPAGDAPYIEALRHGLREVKLIEGQHLRIESRHASGDVSKAPALIAELLALRPQILIAPGPAAARALRRGTNGIPIIAAQLSMDQSDPELYASLARPGGMVTGFSSMGEGLASKRIELLRETVAGVKTVGILHNATDPNFRDWGVATEAAAREQGLTALRRPIASTSPAELAEHFAAFKTAGATAVVVIADFLTNVLKNEINTAAINARIAVFAEHRDIAHAGALLSFGPDIFDLFRRAGVYIDKMLKGATAADLPIQLPTKFQFVVNLKTANALGLTIPPAILIRADEVIE
jgi:putative tryptophan/tyrosine transport system substrate-binding protein